MLAKYLPKRYKVESAFIIDAEGRRSEQIDLVIYDQHYCPFLFRQDSATYIPAESVYAVFEVKPDVGATTLDYACKKAASVRRLGRTSVDIPHAGGTYLAKEPSHIIAGILATNTQWEKPKEKITDVMKSAKPEERLDVGCILGRCGFEVQYLDDITVLTSEAADSLIFFFIRLLYRLQQSGTIPAIDILKYGDYLDPETS